MAFKILKALCGIGEIHRETEITEEQHFKPDSPSTQLDLTHVHDDSPSTQLDLTYVHDDSPSTQLDLTHVHDDRPSTQLDLTHVVKELIDKTEAMEKRLQEVEKLCKNLTAERMEGNSTNLQHSSPLLPSHDDEGDEHLSHTETCCNEQSAS